MAVLRQGFQPPEVFQERYFVENNSQTIVYTHQAPVFPGYPAREKIILGIKRTRVTLIATVRNEVANAQKWVECILAQSRLADELVIVDAGSNDGTWEVLQSAAAVSPIPMRVIREPGANIARGRNIAIAQASHAIIAVTDFGCHPEPTWLELLIAPFEQDERIQVSGGWYEADDPTGSGLYRYVCPPLSQVDPASFIPSSRSVAFTKAVWEMVNGYPEWLSLTGEDTYFALETSKVCDRRAFVPEAIVHWIPPQTARAYWKKMYEWSVGDGESGLHAANYWHALKLMGLGGMAALAGILLLILYLFSGSWILVAVLVIGVVGAGFVVAQRLLRHSRIPSLNRIGIEAGLRAAQVLGYLKGVKGRGAADLRRAAGARGFVFLLAGVPMQDTGGGSRGAQIALEFLRRNYFVVYIYRFESHERVRLPVRFRHPNLIVSALGRFSWEQFAHPYGGLVAEKPSLALVEFPLKDFLPVMKSMQQRGVRIVYDLLDNWDSQLGADWFDRDAEETIIRASSRLVATAPALVDYLHARTDQPVALLPNAVNLRLFTPQRQYPRPTDLPPAEFTITYIGALWGEWFDWDLLCQIARAYPQAAVAIIGDYRKQCPEKLPNLHFLGLKAQTDLPGYLSYTDVTIIPWKVNKITQATSPLKLYEYLAMHVPVVVPDIPVLDGIPSVYLSKDPADFIRNLRIAKETVLDVAQMDAFVARNSWQSRVDEIIQLTALEGPKQSSINH